MLGCCGGFGVGIGGVGTSFGRGSGGEGFLVGGGPGVEGNSGVVAVRRDASLDNLG